MAKQLSYEERERYIRNRLDQGATQAQIAEELGLSRQWVSQLIKGGARSDSPQTRRAQELRRRGYKI